jgi:hypothetical protein
MGLEGKFSITAKELYVNVVLEGQISAQNVVEASRQLLTTTGYYSGKPVIWNATKADLSTIELDMIEKAVVEIDKIYKGLPLGRIALVSERILNIWTIEFFKEMYDKEIVRVFSAFKEAEDWILSFTGENSNAS